MDTLTPVFEAISHPVRRAILARLRKGKARVTEIAAPFDMSLNAVSKHLKILEAAGLIKRVKEGREHWIELMGGPLKEVSGWVHAYERHWNEQLDRMDEYFKIKRSKR